MNTVYVVIKGYEFEGYTTNDLKVFADKADAIEYAETLYNEYTHVSILEQDVEVKTKASKGWANAWPAMPTGH